MDILHIDPGETANADSRPKLVFEEGFYTIPELLDSHLLPVVAQYDSACMPLPFHEFNFDLSQPLLLYKRRNIQKVAARSLYIDDGKYEEIGESLLIPEDYKGWFAVLQRVTGSTRADDSVPHFTSIEEVANSNTDRFLIGGTKKVNGLQLLDTAMATQTHEQRCFLPGDVLTKEKIFYGETKKRSRLFRKPKYITEKFLLCRDESDRDVLLPFEQKGIFYQVSHKYGKAQKNVLQMSDIVARKLTPRIIKLVFGRFPVTPCSFTGLMKAESSKIETSIIASTIINTKNILLEIPLSSHISFRVALTENALRQNACYRSAIRLCAERAITYMRNIKVCYNFTIDDSEEEATPWYTKENNFSPTLKRVDSIKSESLGRHHKPLKMFLSNPDNNSNDKDENSHETLRRGFSVDVNDGVTFRPARCASTGHMSFCLGNSYLTVPVFEPGFDIKRNSGNNNTFSEAIFTTRGGSRISYNGQFFEEEENEKEETSSSLDSSNITIPPSMASTRIDSYVNDISPPSMSPTSEFDDYIPVSACKGPSSQPPDSLPPPPPRSSSTSGVSSGSASPTGFGTPSHRGSNESFEYAVPKTEDPQSILTHKKENNNIASVDANDTDSVKPKLQRPSTLKFSENALIKPTSISTLPGCDVLGKTCEHSAEDGSPVYENIKSLMEMVAQLESLETDIEDRGDTHNDSEKDNTLANIVLDIALHQEETVNKEQRHTIGASQTNLKNPQNFLSLVDGNMNCKETECDIKLPIGVKHADAAESEWASYDKYVSEDNGTVCFDVDMGEYHRERNITSGDKHVYEVTPVSQIGIDEQRDKTSELTTDSNGIFVADYFDNVNKRRTPNYELDYVCPESDSDIETNAELAEVDRRSDTCDGELNAINLQECNESVVDKINSNEYIFETAFKEPNTNSDETPFESPVESVTTCHGKQGFNNIVHGKHCATDQNATVMVESNDLCLITAETTSEALSEIDERCEEIVMEIQTEGSSNGDSNEPELSGIDNSNNVKPSDTTNPWRVAVKRMTSHEEIQDKTCPSVSSRKNIETICKSLPELTVQDVSDRLMAIGIKDASIKSIQEMGVDGMRFQNVLEGTLNIRDCLRGVNLVDQQKISMFIRGWRMDV